MRPSIVLTALLAGAALAFSAPAAQAQVTINIGRPAPPPQVIVVQKAHPVKHAKARYYYQPQPVVLVPARPVYYVRGGHGKGHGHGHGRH